MKAFSLLKYWKTSGSQDVIANKAASSAETQTTKTKVTTTVALNEAENVEDGPFFDLEFTVPEDYYEQECNTIESCSDDDEPEKDLNFTFSSSFSSTSSSTNKVDNIVVKSPSDELFFKGKLHTDPNTTTTNTDHPHIQKSATKFRVFMLGLKKQKPNSHNKSKSTHNYSEEECACNLDQQRFTKDVMQNYLKKKKKLRFSGQLKVGPKGLDDRTQQRRDDSLLQQQDGIQSAILHCKKSFNATSTRELD